MSKQNYLHGTRITRLFFFLIFGGGGVAITTVGPLYCETSAHAYALKTRRPSRRRSCTETFHRLEIRVTSRGTEQYQVENI